MNKTNELRWILFGITLTILAIVVRLFGLGWLATFGIISILIFLPIQIHYLSLDKKMEKPTRKDQILLTSPIFLFPLIFLLQPDFGDSGGVVVMFELLIGNEKRPFIENYSWILAVLIAVSYLIIIVYLSINLKKLRPVINETELEK